MLVHGIITLGENIADYGGYIEAYRPYNGLMKKTRDKSSLPVLPYNPNQLFWLSGAHIFGSIIHPELLKYYVLSDPHSPQKSMWIDPSKTFQSFPSLGLLERFLYESSKKLQSLVKRDQDIPLQMFIDLADKKFLSPLILFKIGKKMLVKKCK